MDSWERLLLYRKKLILPRIYQVLGWVMWITYFFAILFLGNSGVRAWIYDFSCGGEGYSGDISGGMDCLFALGYHTDNLSAG